MGGLEVDFDSGECGVGAIAVGGHVGVLAFVEILAVRAKALGPSVFDASLDVGLDAGAWNGLEDGDDLERKVVGGPSGLGADRPFAGVEARG